VIGQIQVDFDVGPHAWVVELLGHAGAVALVADLLFESGQVVLHADQLHVPQRLGPTAD
jgi:hypothetical protein